MTSASFHYKMFNTGNHFENKSKYNNVKCKYKGMTFDSKKELKRYQELEIMEKAGEIRKLKFHPAPYELSPDPKICKIKYYPDFIYELKVHIAENRYGFMDVVEDCKGVKTPVYNLKKKLLHAKYGIIIKES
jgi:hypothetical protein